MSKKKQPKAAQGWTWVVWTRQLQFTHVDPLLDNPGGGDSAFERGEDARRKFWIKPLKETDLGVAEPFFLPLKETMLKHRQYIFFNIFSRATLNKTFTAKYDSVLPRTP